jgi:hypothetical protein
MHKIIRKYPGDNSKLFTSRRDKLENKLCTPAVTKHIYQFCMKDLFLVLLYSNEFQITGPWNIILHIRLVLPWHG